MAAEHSEVAAELWALAETVLTRLEPILARAVQDQASAAQQGCSWCPVCALAALIRGEQHDLLTLMATEGGVVVAMLRQLIAEHSGASRPTPGAAPSAPGTTPPPTDGEPAHTDEGSIGRDTEEPVVRRAGFVPITVNVTESAQRGQGDRGERDT